LIYLDNAATSFPKPERVYVGMDAFVRAAAANPGRSGHHMAVQAEAMIDDTRRLLARLFNAPRPERVVFTLNATDALNMAIKGVLQPGDHVVSSVLEHNSINRPLERLARDGVIALTRVPAGADHRIDPEAVAAACTPRTRLLAFTHASNVTGAIQPVAELGRVARERDALLLVDAAQTAGVVPIDLEGSQIDLLAFTGHKGLLGPTGTGGLAVGERADVDPWREGGTGGDSSSAVQPRELPYRLEGGTPNVFGIAGLRDGVRYLLERGIDTVLPHERHLLTVFFTALRQPDRFSFFGAERDFSERGGEGRVGLLSFNLEGLAPVELAMLLDEHFSIAVRPGLHCAPYAHRHLGTFPQGTVRISPGVLTTEDEMRAAAAALDELATGVA